MNVSPPLDEIAGWDANSDGAVRLDGVADRSCAGLVRGPGLPSVMNVPSLYEPLSSPTVTSPPTVNEGSSLTGRRP